MLAYTTFYYPRITEITEMLLHTVSGQPKADVLYFVHKRSFGLAPHVTGGKASIPFFNHFRELVISQGHF